jgi:hypothetical protein
MVMMNDCISLDFLGKRCKYNFHTLCDGQWKGLGFQVYCNCECHRKLGFGKDVRDNNSSNEKNWKEFDYKGESNK